MRSTGIVRSHNSPLRIVPQRGKVREYSVKPPRSEHWAVLHEREPGLYLANDPGHFGPQSRVLAFDACSFSCNGNVGAWEPSADNIDDTSPLVSVKRCNVIENREPWKHTVRLPLGKDLLAIVIDLDGTHGLMSE